MEDGVGSPPGGSRSSISQAETSRSRTRTARCTVVPQRRDLQFRRAQPGASPLGPPDLDPLGHRDDRARLRGVGSRIRRASAWHVRASRSGTAPRRRLVLARDRFGIKPLYYRHCDGELSFASELDALPQGELDLDALEAFLATNVVRVHSRSSAGSASSLPGMCSSGRGQRSVTIERYARPRPLPVRHADEAELVEECRARLADSVSAHLVADVPVGVLLSGGVDSGALTALAARAAREPVRTFSIGFDGQAFDELEGARAVSSATPPNIANWCAARRRALLPALAAASTSRSPTRRRFRPTWLPSSPAGRQGDALGRGRRRALRRLPHLRCRHARRSPRTAREGAAAGDRSLPSPPEGSSLDYRAKRFARAAHLPPLERHQGWKESFRPTPAPSSTGRPERLRPLELERARFAETEGHELLARLQDIDLGGYLVDDLLVKTDRASMAWSLETRVPFLDTVVTELRALPSVEAQDPGLSRRSGCCARRSSRSSPRRSCTAGSAASRFRRAAWLRGELEAFARETLSRKRCAARATSAPTRYERVIDDVRVAGRRTSRASSGGCSCSRSGSSTTSRASAATSTSRAPSSPR